MCRRLPARYQACFCTTLAGSMQTYGGGIAVRGLPCVLDSVALARLVAAQEGGWP